MTKYKDIEITELPSYKISMVLQDLDYFKDKLNKASGIKRDDRI